MSSRFLTALAVALIVGLASCSKPPISVSGTVKFNGESAYDGNVSFDASDPPIAVSTPIRDGQYSTTLPGTAAGKEIGVRIQATRKTGRRVPIGPPAPPDQMTDELAQSPEKYIRPNAFRITAKPGDANRFDFDLESK